MERNEERIVKYLEDARRLDKATGEKNPGFRTVAQVQEALGIAESTARFRLERLVQQTVFVEVRREGRTKFYRRRGYWGDA